MKSAPAVLVLIIFIVGIFAVINGTDSTFSSTGDAIKMSKMPSKVPSSKMYKSSGSSSDSSSSDSSSSDPSSSDSSSSDSSSSDPSSSDTSLPFKKTESDTVCSKMASDDLCLTINGCDAALVSAVIDPNSLEVLSSIPTWYQEDFSKSDNPYDFSISVQYSIDSIANSIELWASDYYGADKLPCVEKAAKSSPFDPYYLLDLQLRSKGEVVAGERFVAHDFYSYSTLNPPEDILDVYGGGSHANIFTLYSLDSIESYLPDWFNWLLEESGTLNHLEDEVSSLRISEPSSCTKIKRGDALALMSGYDTSAFDFGIGLSEIMADKQTLCLSEITLNLELFEPNLYYDTLDFVNGLDFSGTTSHSFDATYSDSSVDYEIDLDFECPSTMGLETWLACEALLELLDTSYSSQDYCTASGSTTAIIPHEIRAPGFKRFTDISAVNNYRYEGVCKHFQTHLDETIDSQLLSMVASGHEEELQGLLSHSLYSYTLHNREHTPKDYYYRSRGSYTNEEKGFAYFGLVELVDTTSSGSFDGLYTGYLGPFGELGILHHPETEVSVGTNGAGVDSAITFDMFENYEMKNYNYAVLSNVNTLNTFLYSYNGYSYTNKITSSDEVLSGYPIASCKVISLLAPPVITMTRNSLPFDYYDSNIGELVALTQRVNVECTNADGSKAQYDVAAFTTNYGGLTIYPTFGSSDYMDLYPNYGYNIMFSGGTDTLRHVTPSDLDYLLDQIIIVPLRNYVRENYPSPNSNYFEVTGACDNFAHELYVGAWCAFE